MKQTYINVLNLAKENGIRSIVMPVISVGRFSFPKEMGAAFAIDCVRSWKKINPDYNITVSFSVADAKVYKFLCLLGN